MARKKARRKKRPHTRKRPDVSPKERIGREETPAPSDKPLRTARFVSGIVLDVLLIVLALLLLLKLAGHAKTAVFFTDECFHNYVINLTIENGRVPGFLPDIYSGKKNIEPPLFHATGAVFKTLFGKDAMPYFNIFLLVVMLAAMYTLIRVFIHANAARLSLLFIMSSQFIHQYSLVFYLELISGLAFFLGVFLLMLALYKKRYVFYVIAGLGGAVMLLSKISAIIVLPFYFACAALYLVMYIFKKEKLITVIGPVIVAGVALLGSMVFFLAATDNPGGFAYRTFVRPVKTLALPKLKATETGKKDKDDDGPKKMMKAKEFWTIKNKMAIVKGVRAGSGKVLLAAVIIALVNAIFSVRWSAIPWLFKEGRRMLWSLIYLLSVCLIFFIIHLINPGFGKIFLQGAASFTALVVLYCLIGNSTAFWGLVFLFYAFFTFLYSPAVADRHFIALLPIVAFLGGYGLHNLAELLSGVAFRKKGVRVFQFAKVVGIISVVCFVTLFTINAAGLSKIPNHRAPLNQTVKPILEPIRFIAKNTPEDSMVFTMWAYSTLYYSGRKATWGANARGLRDIYFVKDPQELHSRCREAGITHFLIDRTRIWPDDKYNTVVFTETMINNLIDLIGRGKAEVMWPKKPTPQRPATIRFTVIKLNFESDDEEKPEG